MEGDTERTLLIKLTDGGGCGKEKEQKGVGTRWGSARGLAASGIQATFPSEVSINLAVPSSSNFCHLQSSGQHEGGVSTFWKLYLGQCPFLCSCTYEGLLLEMGRVGGVP